MVLGTVIDLMVPSDPQSPRSLTCLYSIEATLYSGLCTWPQRDVFFPSPHESGNCGSVTPKTYLWEPQAGRITAACSCGPGKPARPFQTTTLGLRGKVRGRLTRWDWQEPALRRRLTPIPARAVSAKLTSVELKQDLGPEEGLPDVPTPSGELRAHLGTPPKGQIHPPGGLAWVSGYSTAPLTHPHPISPCTHACKAHTTPTVLQGTTWTDVL